MNLDIQCSYVNTMERLLEPERAVIFIVSWVDDRDYALLPELYGRFVSLHDKDLPWEEMGVDTREMGFLYGQYTCLAGHSQGSFTGLRLNWSGSSLRSKATGYGLVIILLFAP
ncbi:hypothetical protein Tco_0265169 [Tanacetum coccineum]